MYSELWHVAMCHAGRKQLKTYQDYQGSQRWMGNLGHDDLEVWPWTWPPQWTAVQRHSGPTRKGQILRKTALEWRAARELQHINVIVFNSSVWYQNARPICFLFSHTKYSSRFRMPDFSPSDWEVWFTIVTIDRGKKNHQTK